MSGRKKKSRPRKGRGGKGSTEIHRGPTRDPGGTGNVGCMILGAGLVLIALAVAAFELIG
ncbi:hypothetical protein [Nocardiopsis suaedae]|uniref:Uncharacterized protein n=1 Tax=Nocardiopsis suaedae TaxID=3018444 RepID=A0ABT4TEE5_9ACTN|nr:hypothetical protein [Nocardiopsis suaedae]MDA2803080.1 hypothetical protein [Nocardiopsis suaedae]